MSVPVPARRLALVPSARTAADASSTTRTHHAPTAPPARLASIDILRGIVIVLMALDHVRAYFTEVRFDPLDLAQTNAALFLTRWITHYCAPTFILLAGVSAYLVSRRLTQAELGRFLLTRGLWMIVLEVTVVHFTWSFNLRYDMGVLLQVIWAIGASMVVLAGLVRLPLRAIAAVGVTMIAGHNLLDGIEPEVFGAWAPVWNLLHVPATTSSAFIVYPLIPWIGVMALGYVLGRAYELDVRQRQRLFVMLGAGAIALFIVLRLANGHGDPNPWSAQQSGTFTVLSFLSVEKYPPSLLYLLMTLGPALLALAALEHAAGRLAEVLRTFGRVPLFVYLSHILLAHLAAGSMALATGYGAVVLTNAFFEFPSDFAWGYGLAGVYVAWLLILFALYPACRWFAEVKRTRKEWWLSYL